jgi:hypothetical protein
MRDWEDDPDQERCPDETGGTNGISLSLARIGFARTGHSDPEKVRRNAAPKLP